MELQLIFNDYIGLLSDCIGRVNEHLYYFSSSSLPSAPFLSPICINAMLNIPISESLRCEN